MEQIQTRINAIKEAPRQLIRKGNTNELINNVKAVKNTEVESLAEDLSFLSTKQQALRGKEIAACETTACEIGVKANWKAIEASQLLAFAGGIAAGIPAELHDAVKGIYDLATHPKETYRALKALANDDNVLGKMSDAVKEKWIAHIDNMLAAQERGGVEGYFQAGVEGGKLVIDVAMIGAGGVGLVKAGTSVVKSGVAAGGKLIEKTTPLIPSRVSKYPTVKLADTGMKWSEGNPSQGKPFETYYGKTFLPESTQTPKTFQAYDFIDEATGSSVSVKTLDTLTKSRLEDPSKLYSSIKDNINDVLKFKHDKKGDFEYYAKDVTSKEVVVGVPAATNDAQWEQINRAIQYGSDNDVKVTIIRVAD
ncbi:hypothetical protein ABK905_07405 [Acerihabitans sp. KWT182]|uniref:CdiA toxin EC869-like domain-containing protein n=1 Tax=Acerihabitans sp. KWT182 TaxID=3157919 RepID=A0AAU7QE03_9GAMM